MAGLGGCGRLWREPAARCGHPNGGLPVAARALIVKPLDPADHELLLIWHGGDRRGGDLLFYRHFASVRRFFHNKTCNEPEVEELIQRTFAASVESAERFRGDSSFKTWLLAIARNVLREWIRESLREGADDHEIDELCSERRGPGLSSRLDVQREQHLLLAALRRLPVESQTLLELFYWEELTAGELAEVLGVPEEAVQTRLREAKLELRGTIEQLAPTKAELDSIDSDLDGWARRLRTALA
jgi:RNA polymerase sigma factor (sigma-70 family)